MKPSVKQNLRVFFRTLTITGLLLFCLMALAVGCWYCDRLMQTVIG